MLSYYILNYFDFWELRLHIFILHIYCSYEACSITFKLLLFFSFEITSSCIIYLLFLYIHTKILIFHNALKSILRRRLCICIIVCALKIYVKLRNHHVHMDRVIRMWVIRVMRPHNPLNPHANLLCLRF